MTPFEKIARDREMALEAAKAVGFIRLHKFLSATIYDDGLSIDYEGGDEEQNQMVYILHDEMRRLIGWYTAIERGEKTK